MSDSVRVAVRVRPFNTREKDRGAKLIIKMNGPSTVIVNPHSQEEKTFTFDFSYWSHDGFDTDSTGLMTPSVPKYADQKKVFDELGRDVLNNAFKGYNCSLFAYGQTGSGKSYSMVGYGVNKGIVPISCDEIFKYIASSTSTSLVFHVSLQMLEIYNEQVRDLLIPMDKNPKGGLKVRQHPQLGVQVVGLSDVPVNSYREIEKWMEAGTHNRTVASTQMNSTSSRAHTVVAITFTQVEKNGKGPGQDKETVSKINLVDLAGSERAESTGATGDRLKEGAAINLSLTMLGNVITALAEKANNPKKKILVPYRDSKLTQILQDALGGNSKTIMIAALSPADINYEETLSTLRYADRAKQIKNKAIVNVDPMEVLVQELKAENARLLSQIKDLKSGRPASKDEDDDEDEGGESGKKGKTDAESEELRLKLEEMQSILSENQKMMENQSKSWQTKLDEARKEREQNEARIEQEEKKKKNVPHLKNINEDPLLCNMLNHMLEMEVETVGLRNSTPTPTIPMTGVSIHAKHAELRRQGSIFTLKAIGDARVLHNGHPLGIDQVVEFHHGDRVLFGTNHLYYLSNPFEMAEKGLADVSPTWEEAQQEIIHEQGFAVEANKDMKEMTETERTQFLLQEELIRVIPLVNEANLISAELDKNVNFEVKIINKFVNGAFKPELGVRMKHTNTQASWMWSSEKFINRVFIMREHYTRFTDGEDMRISQEQDPFWDPNEPVLIGVSNVYLNSLSYMIEFDDNVDIKDYKGKNEGILHVKVLPCNSKGVTVDHFGEDEEDLFVEDPKELLGKRIDFVVEISYARGLNPKYVSLFCKYTFNGQVHQTKVVEGTINPDFKFTKQFTFEKVDKPTLELLMKGMLQIETFGTQKEESASGNAKGQGHILKDRNHLELNAQLSACRDQGSIAVYQGELAAMRSMYAHMNRRLKNIEKIVDAASTKGLIDADVAQTIHQAASGIAPKSKLKGAVHTVTATSVAMKAVVQAAPDQKAAGASASSPAPSPATSAVKPATGSNPKAASNPGAKPVGNQNASRACSVM